ncbi:MAG: hypothetical protein ACP5G0_08885 [Desulfomonilia bacterium]
MSDKSGKKFSVGQVLGIQTAVSFGVIAVLVVLAGLLVFHVMGTDYTRFTVVGFVSTVYLAFIVFQPAGTLFAARKEFIEGKVILHPEASHTGERIARNPWLSTLPASIPIAFLSVSIIVSIIYGFGWTPVPVLAVAISLLYVVPHYLITHRFIRQDLECIAQQGAQFTSEKNTITGHVWGNYVLTNFIFQSVINIPLGNRAFSQEMLRLSAEYPDLSGLVPAAAVGVDLAVTFMFVCNFTFLAATLYTISDMYLGILPVTIAGKGKGINGFLYFLIMIFMGFVLGAIYGLLFNCTGYEHISFEVAILSKVLCVFFAVYLGSRLGMGWTAKKVKAHLASLGLSFP